MNNFYKIISWVTVPVEILPKKIVKAEKDTFFRISLNEKQKSIRIKWASDSSEIKINYNKLKGGCSPDQLNLENMTSDGNELIMSGGIIIIKK